MSRLMPRRAALSLAVSVTCLCALERSGFAQDDAAQLARQAAMGDWSERQQAVEQLAAEHGALAVNSLLRWIGSSADVEARVNGVMALRRLGPEAVEAMAAALHSSDAMTRTNLALALAAAGDDRAVPALLRLAQHDADPVVRNHVAEALEQIASRGPVSGGRAVDAFVDLARRYLAGEFPGEGDAPSRVLTWSGGRVQSRSVPASMRGAAYARVLAEEALRLDPAHEGAQETLLAAYDRMATVIRGLAEGSGDDVVDDETSTWWQEQLPRIEDLLRLGGVASSFADAGAEEEPAAAAEPMAGAMDLLRGGDKRLRYNAALSLAAPGASSDVVQALADALSESAVRKVLVIHDDPVQVNELVAALDSDAVHATGATSGALGLMEAKATRQDVIIVCTTVKDVPADRLVAILRRDARTRDAAVILLADESDRERLEAMFGDTVAGVVPVPATLPVLQPSLDAAFERAALNAERMEAEDFSRRSAEALAGLDAADLGPAVPALVDALGRPDPIRIPALHALAKVGAPEAEVEAARIFGDASASAEAQFAAARALEGILSRNPARPETLTALTAALGSEDANLRSAAASVLGSARSLDATERTRLLLENSLPA